MSDEQNDGSEVQEVELDPTMVSFALERLRAEQNLTGGLVAGAVASLAGAVAWALITVATGYQIGFMAIGVGFLVAVANRAVGKGLDQIFGIAGAALALSGCLVGNLLIVLHYVAEVEQIGFFELLPLIDYRLVPQLMIDTFSPMDLVFYAIAIYQGYRTSFRQISLEELQSAAPGGSIPAA